jgi:hypothetical protein
VAGRRHRTAADPATGRRAGADPHPDRRRRDLRDAGRVHVLLPAARLRLPAARPAVVRAAGSWAGLPRRARDRAVPGRARAATPADPDHAHGGGGVRRLGAAALRSTRRPRGVLVRLPGAVPLACPAAAGVRRGVRRRHLPRAARHRPACVDLAGHGPDRAPGLDGQPAVRCRRWLRLLRRRSDCAGTPDRAGATPSRDRWRRLGRSRGSPAARRAATRCCSPRYRRQPAGLPSGR